MGCSMSIKIVDKPSHKCGIFFIKTANNCSNLLIQFVTGFFGTRTHHRKLSLFHLIFSAIKF